MNIPSDVDGRLYRAYEWKIENNKKHGVAAELRELCSAAGSCAYWDRRRRLMSSAQTGYTTSSSVSKDGTYLWQRHAPFKLWWCMQHLACTAVARVWKRTAKQLRSFDLWTHLPHFWLSSHSFNLYP